MSPERTSPGGYYRFDWERGDVGRIRLKSGARTLGEHRRRVALLDKLYDVPGGIDLLKALQAGQLSIAELVAADRTEHLATTASELVARRPLVEAINAALPRLGRGAETRRRYATSLRKLQQLAPLTSRMRVADLRTLDYVALRQRWTGSPSDWMHLRRAVSTFLSYTLGDTYHPFRREVMKRIPREDEHERVPDLSPDAFLRVAALTPEWARSSYFVLVITGLRLGEYLRLTPEHLMPTVHALRVPGRKTKQSKRVLPVDPRLWPWLERGVPAQLQAGWLRRYWYRACEEAGVVPRRASAAQRIHLHDLRHCTGQWLADYGQALTSIKETLGHATIGMTEKYARQVLRAQDALAMGDILAVPQVAPQPRTSRNGRR